MRRQYLDDVMDALELVGFDTQLSAAELETRARVKAVVDSAVRPNIADWYERGEFTPEVVPALAEAGLFGMHLEGYGCAGRTAVEYGLACAELEAGDSGIRTLVSVQGSLAMTAIHHHGSEEQKQEWLPRMAAGTALGCFALTEPTAGSDPASMRTTAVRDGDDWVLTGSKRWIGLASDRRDRGRLGEDGRWGARVPRAHGIRRIHRDADRAEAVAARIGAVRHRARRRAGARVDATAGRGRPEGRARSASTRRATASRGA